MRLDVALAALRSGFVIAGLLLLGVGIADLVAGGSKVAEYRRVLQEEPAPPPPTQPSLFPASSESAQRIAVARTKLGYYELLRLVGRMLAALGLVLCAVGLVRERLRAPRNLAPPRGFVDIHQRRV